MGCTQSTAAQQEKVQPDDTTPPSTSSKDAMTDRITSIDETRKATFGGVTVRYAYLSQRGYYPDGEWWLGLYCSLSIIIYSNLCFFVISYHISMFPGVLSQHQTKQIKTHTRRYQTLQGITMPSSLSTMATASRGTNVPSSSVTICRRCCPKLASRMMTSPLISYRTILIGLTRHAIKS